MLVMLVAALWFLHLELRDYTLQEFREGFMAIPAWHLVLAVFLTLLNYAILICYDWLGIWYIRHPMKFGRVALASFLGYSVGNNFGLLFGGSTIRYRLYSTWGLSAAEIVKLLFILAITFWIGLFALSGVVFLIDPLKIPDVVNLPVQTTRPLGIVLTTLAVLYLVASALGKPIKFGKKRFYPPPFGLSCAQYVVASIDLLVAAAVVYVLLPESIDISYFNFVGVFLLAQVAVFVTQVPGGLGVLEMMLIALLAPVGPAKADLFAALLAYRLIFYLTPMAIGIVMLGLHEAIAQRRHLKRAFGLLGSAWTPDIAPRFAALLVFFCGVCVLFAVALPVDDQRMELLATILPRWLIEISYFLSGVIGMLLLLFSRGLYRRLTIAWWMTVASLVVAIGLALSSSLGYAQLIILLVGFCVVAPIGHYFHRRGRLFSDNFAWHWMIAVSVVLLLAFWMFWFAYKKRDDLGFDIWNFALHADSQRSLRALLGAFVVAAGYYTVRILQISIGRPETTTHAELQVARRIVAESPESAAWLALQGDKRLLFNEANTAMVAWSVRNRSCVALGNPVGPLDDAVQIAWDFFDMCQQNGHWPVFFQVDNRYATLFPEMNLQMFHIADDALVDLRRFDPDMPEMQRTRESRESAFAAGYRFRVAMPEEVRPILPDLQRIDRTWQHDRGGQPWKFSNSCFVPEMICQTPVALLEREDRIVGFASLWCGHDNEELAAGLIRYLPDSPADSLDVMLAESMLWGQTRDFRHFNLGPAPLSQWHSPQHQDARASLMNIAFRLGRHFYSYQGLRNYLERFTPAWQPLFLAWPHERPLNRVFMDIAELIGSASPEAEPSKRGSG